MTKLKRSHSRFHFAGKSSILPLLHKLHMVREVRKVGNRCTRSSQTSLLTLTFHDSPSATFEEDSCHSVLWKAPA